MPVFWGPHFPDSGGHTFWSLHFPDGQLNPLVFPGYGPPGSATIALDLDGEFTVRLDWGSDVIKARAGAEQRVCALDDAPQLTFRGSAVMFGNDPRSWRTQLATYAALGSTMLLGMPHEGLDLVADATGTSVAVGAAALAAVDWAVTGQRVVVRGIDPATGAYVAKNAVVQSAGGGAIVLDVAPASIGAAGGVVMPAFAVILDPQQDFQRYPTEAEAWEINAQAVVYDFSLPRAELDMGPMWPGFVICSRDAGVVGNLLCVTLNASPANPGVVLDEMDLSGLTETEMVVKGDTSTLGELADFINTYSGLLYVRDDGMNRAQVISSADAFAAIRMLAGGASEGLVGTGAALATYNGHPVWDRRIDVRDTAGDSIQALTEVIALGGKPYALGVADAPDWGRAVRLDGKLGVDWQFVKLFLWTARGAQRSFWLPTWRDDLTPTATGAGTITVRNDDGGGVFQWFPAQRQHLQVVQADDSVTRAMVVDAVDNGDGTVTLSIADPSTGLPVTIGGAAVASISWLELCRFESDSFDVKFTGSTFEFETVARVVQS